MVMLHGSKNKSHLSSLQGFRDESTILIHQEFLYKFLVALTIFIYTDMVEFNLNFMVIVSQVFAIIGDSFSGDPHGRYQK